jgi:hypothetical protein
LSRLVDPRVDTGAAVVDGEIVHRDDLGLAGLLLGDPLLTSLGYARCILSAEPLLRRDLAAVDVELIRDLAFALPSSLSALRAGEISI